MTTSVIPVRIKLNGRPTALINKRGERQELKNDFESFEIELPAKPMTDAGIAAIKDAVGPEFADMALGAIYRISALAALKDTIE